MLVLIRVGTAGTPMRVVTELGIAGKSKSWRQRQGCGFTHSLRVFIIIIIILPWVMHKDPFPVAQRSHPSAHPPQIFFSVQTRFVAAVGTRFGGQPRSPWPGSWLDIHWTIAGTGIHESPQRHVRDLYSFRLGGKINLNSNGRVYCLMLWINDNANNNHPDDDNDANSNDNYSYFNN